MAKTSGGNRVSTGSVDRRSAAERSKPFNATMELKYNENTRYISKRFKTENEANAWNESVERRFLFKKGFSVMSSTIEKTMKTRRVKSVKFYDLAEILYGQKAYRNKTGFYAK